MKKGNKKIHGSQPRQVHQNSILVHAPMNRKALILYHSAINIYSVYTYSFTTIGFTKATGYTLPTIKVRINVTISPISNPGAPSNSSSSSESS
jgi:hypothetical protein